MMTKSRLLPLLLIGVALAGCRQSGDIVVNEGVGITAVRTACPAVGIPDYTGDITVFRAPGSTTLADLDAVAAMTNLTSTCNEGTDKVTTEVAFDVEARRTDTRGARQLVLPYYITVLRGGSAVVSKRIGQVAIQFADGQERATGRATGTTFIDRAEATLPEDVRQQIVKPRKAGEADAAVDPLTDPAVKAAVQRATFEVLVGFNLTEAQLRYNATR